MKFLTEQNREYYIAGVAPIVIAASLWALGYLLRKLILHAIHPIPLTFFTCCVVSVSILLIYRIRFSEVKRAFLVQPFVYTALALTGVALGTTLFHLALRELDLGVTTLLEKLRPVYTLILASIFLRERFPIEKSLYIILAIASSYFIAKPDPFHFGFGEISALGIAAVLGAGLSWASASVVGKKAVSTDDRAEVVTLLRFGLGGLMLLPLVLAHEQLNLKIEMSVSVAAIIVIAALVSTLLGYSLFYKGLRHVDAGVSAFLELVTPVVAVMLGLTFLGESLTPLQAATIPLLLWSVYKLSIKAPVDDS